MRVLSSGLLLGAAASLAMASGAGAADLPMKAKAPAVQYVKICSLYGAGFYYIPGTDTCLKIGAHMRIDFYTGASAAPDESLDYGADWDDASTRMFRTKARAYATFDARAQTAYGTLRSYFLIGANYEGNGDGDALAGGGRSLGVYMNRAFVQLAGFTWGLTTSIFDLYTITPFHLNYVAATNGSVGATGIWQWRYTAQFGNGFSASIAIEDPRQRGKAIFDGTVVGPGCPAPTVGCHIGAEWPDVVASLNASGSWGRALIAVAVTDASAIDPTTASVSDTIDELGWAATTSAFLRVPGLPGDTFGITFRYAKGAVEYVTGNANVAGGTGIFAFTKDAQVATGALPDGTIIAPGVMDLTTVWSVEAGYEHAWSKTLKTSLAGGYVESSHSAAADAVLCGAMGGICTDAGARFWNVGSRTQWSPVPNFSLALDVMYHHIDSASTGAGFGDADVWTALVRVRRDYVP